MWGYWKFEPKSPWDLAQLVKGEEGLWEILGWSPNGAKFTYQKKKKMEIWTKNYSQNVGWLIFFGY